MMVILIVGLIVAMINQSIINIIIPRIMVQFQVTATTAQWLATGFMLAAGILVPVSAFLVQRYSYRNLFLTAIFLFAIGSFLCAISPNFAAMLAGRLVQACGAGILMPLCMNIFLASFPVEKRGSAMGLFGLGVILAPALGPTIGGYVMEFYNWHILFWAMAIIASGVGIVAVFKFRFQNDFNTVKLDIVGLITSTLGFGGLLYGFSEVGTNGFGGILVIGPLVIAAIALAVFIVYELRKENPLLELKIFKDYNFTITMIVNIVLAMALFGGLLLLPLYLQSIRDFSPLDSGLLLLPGTLLMGILGVFTGKIYDKYGIKMLATFGIGIVTIATFMLSRLSLDTPYFYIMIIYAVRSVGMSFVSMPFISAGLVTIHPEFIPHAIAIQNTFRSVAGSLGAATLVVVMTGQTRVYTQELDPNPDIFQAQMAAVHGVNDAFLLAAGFAAVALILTFFLKKKAPPAKINRNG